MTARCITYSWESDSSPQASRPTWRGALSQFAVTCLLFLGVCGSPLPLWGQGGAQPGALEVIEEDLEETFEDPAPAPAAELDPAAVQQLFTEAENTYLTQDPGAFSLFGRLVDLFETHLMDRQAAEELAAEEPTAKEIADAAEPPLDAPDGSGDGGTAATGEDPSVAPLSADEPAADAAPTDGAAVEEEEVGPPPPPAELRFLEPSMVRLFVRSLLYRAQLAYDFGEDALVESSLERALDVDPGVGGPPPEVDDTMPTQDIEPPIPVPESIAEALERLRRQRIGQAQIQVEPPDAEIRMAGRPLPAGQTASVPAGTVWLQVQRPGYTPWQEEVNVRAGRTLEQNVELERLGPVLRFHTRPSGAEVFLDGRPVGLTSGQADGDRLTVGSYRSEEFSAEIVLDGFEPGVRRLEVRREGYRPYRAELELYELLDYPLPPIVLEGERGLLVFRNFPNDGKLLVDGQAHAMDNPGSSRPQVTLPPGEYELTIESGRSSMFSTRLRLADRQTIDVDVKLRPGLAFLGVIDDNASRRQDLAQALRLALGRSGKWALLDRSDAAGRLLQGLQIDADALRREATAPVLGQHVDWSQVQWSADQRTPGLIYVLAVVSDTLLERRTTLFVWPSAPGPAVPDRMNLSGTDSATLQRLENAFNRPSNYQAPWLGAVLVSSPLAPHPLVYDVTPGGPAEAAGLQAGDLLVAVSGVPVFSPKDVDARLAAAEIGEVLDLGAQRSTGPQALRFHLKASPSALDLKEEGLLRSVAFTDLQLEAASARPEIAWLLRLDQGRLLLDARQFEEAVRRLRDVDAPQTSHGFGQAAVDYWLGLALEKLGGDYRDAARQAFERAARLPGARLGHHDGPFVAPRAEARLLALGSF